MNSKGSRICQNLWEEAKAALRVEFIALTILLKIKDWKGLTASCVSETRRETIKHQKKVGGRNWCVRKKKKRINTESQNKALSITLSVNI